MGSRNANSGGRLDRAEVAEMSPGGIVPEGLVKRLDSMVGWEPSDSPRAVALKEAADVLRNLPKKLSDERRLDDPAFQSRSYRIDTHQESSTMRIVYYGQSGQKEVLAFAVLSTPESYEMAQAILKNYDKLEGIDK